MQCNYSSLRSKIVAGQFVVANPNNWCFYPLGLLPGDSSLTFVPTPLWRPLELRSLSIAGLVLLTPKIKIRTLGSFRPFPLFTLAIHTKHCFNWPESITNQNSSAKVKPTLIGFWAYPNLSDQNSSVHSSFLVVHYPAWWKQFILKQSFRHSQSPHTHRQGPHGYS